MLPKYHRYSWGWHIEWLGWFLCGVTKPYKQVYLSPDATPDHPHARTLYAHYPQGDW